MTVSGEERSLSPTKKKLIMCLLNEHNVTRACSLAGLHRSVYSKWLRTDPLFAEELEAQRNEVLEESMSTLKLSLSKAVNKLTELLDSDNEEVRRKACNDILGIVLKLKSSEDIESKLVELETLVLERRVYR